MLKRTNDLKCYIFDHYKTKDYEKNVNRIGFRRYVYGC